MKDCKDHYSAMYETRLGMAPCPWCEIEKLKDENRRLTEQMRRLSVNDGGLYYVEE